MGESELDISLDLQSISGTFISGATHRLLKPGHKHVEEPAAAPGSGRRKPPPKPRAPVSRSGPQGKRGRGVTVQDLVLSGLLQPGKGKMGVHYKGQAYTATLTADGNIEFQDQRFQSATSFSMHCKRLVTPNKQGDDGWKSVLYEGRPLAVFRHKYQERFGDDPFALTEAGRAAAAAAAAAAGTTAAAAATTMATDDEEGEDEAAPGPAHDAAPGAAGQEQQQQGQQQQQQQQQQRKQQQQQRKEKASPAPAKQQTPSSGGRKKKKAAAPKSGAAAADGAGASPEPMDVEEGQQAQQGQQQGAVVESDQWVQCDRCQEWRIVPDDHWGAVQADTRQAWFCEYAAWDVAQLPPHTPACS